MATREADRTPDVVYRCQRTGLVYTRPAAEFLDGRFKRVGRSLPPRTVVPRRQGRGNG
jgi:hypothetical protein